MAVNDTPKTTINKKVTGGLMAAVAILTYIFCESGIINGT